MKTKDKVRLLALAQSGIERKIIELRGTQLYVLDRFVRQLERESVLLADQAAKVSKGKK